MSLELVSEIASACKTDTFRDPIDPKISQYQQSSGKLHSEFSQQLHWSGAVGPCKSFGKARSAHAGKLRQTFDRVIGSGRLQHGIQRGPEPAVDQRGKPGHVRVSGGKAAPNEINDTLEQQHADHGAATEARVDKFLDEKC